LGSVRKRRRPRGKRTKPVTAVPTAIDVNPKITENSLAATRDVDQCMGATPEKRPRLDMWQSDTNASVTSVEDVNNDPGERCWSLSMVVKEDVDMRPHLFDDHIDVSKINNGPRAKSGLPPLFVRPAS
jgi:hypothetical protein